MHFRKLWTCSLLLHFAVLSLNVQAQTIAEHEPRAINYDFPLLDEPFNFKNSTKGTFPSMAQSLAVSRTLYDISHYGIEHGLKVDPHERGWLGFGNRMAFAFADFFVLNQLPGGQGWMHEEWHRAVMTNRGISSYNDVYNLKLGSSVIAVSHESDEDLVMLKRDHPEDNVRLSEAGMESEHALAHNLEEDTFFHDNTSYRMMLLLNLKLSPFFYLNTCSGKDADKTTDKQNELDSDSIPKRDFVGLDCDGWIRDLNRRNEDFSARGVHPSGVGINRYTKYSDLDDEEKKYLHLNRNLSLLNFIDPFIWDHNGFEGSGLFGESTAKYNANLRHDLTSFGYSVSANFFYKSPQLKSLATIYGYRNHLTWFPGLEMQVYEIPMGSQNDWLVTLRGQIWQQPKDFSFDTHSGETGGLAGVRFGYNRNEYLNPYVSLVAKSRGWVVGQVEQNRNFQTIVGVNSEIR